MSDMRKVFMGLTAATIAGVGLLASYGTPSLSVFMPTEQEKSQTILPAKTDAEKIEDCLKQTGVAVEVVERPVGKETMSYVMTGDKRLLAENATPIAYLAVIRPQVLTKDFEVLAQPTAQQTAFGEAVALCATAVNNGQSYPVLRPLAHN